MSAGGGIEILDARTSEHRARWLSLWERWQEREVQAHPTYVDLFARDVDRPALIVRDFGGRGVLFPIVARPLQAEPWGDRDSWDVTTPYGYGGPYAWGSVSEEETSTFWDEYERAARELRWVSTFARLSLFPEQLVALRGEVVSPMSNVVRTLDLDDDAMWRDYAHKVRKNVKRARDSALVVEVDTTGRDLDAFVDIYSSTMERRSAADAYRFDRAFFERIVRELAGSCAFFHVRSGDRIVSTELVLVSASNLYSFLGGTLAEAFDLRPNDLLKHEVIRWGHAASKRAFVLGGGYGADDGIYRYKLAFAPEGARPFRVLRSIHDEAAYAGLVNRRGAWEAERGADWAPPPNRFPAYRG